MIEELPNLLKNSHFFCTPFETFWVVFLLPKMGRPGSFTPELAGPGIQEQRKDCKVGSVCGGGT